MVGQVRDRIRYLFECDQPHCYRRLTFDTPEAVEHERLNHKCPYWGGESKVSWSVTKTLVQQMWDMLDAELDQLKGHWSEDKGTWMTTRPIDPEYHKHRARAISECLALFMRPFFETADDIAREALKRWEARRDSNTEYETAGIGMRRYETAANAHLSATPGWYGTAQDGYTSDPTRAGSPSVNRGRGAATRAATRPAVVVSSRDREQIKMAYEGMPQIFTPTVLATQYKVPISVVKEILGLD